MCGELIQDQMLYFLQQWYCTFLRWWREYAHASSNTCLSYKLQVKATETLADNSRIYWMASGEFSLGLCS